MVSKRQGYMDHHSNVMTRVAKGQCATTTTKKQLKNLLFHAEVEISNSFCQNESKIDRDVT